MDIYSLHGIFACFATRLLRAPLWNYVAPSTRLRGADRGFGLPLKSSLHQASLNYFMLRRADSALLLCSNLCCGLFCLLQRHSGTSHLLSPANQLSSWQCQNLLNPPSWFGTTSCLRVSAFRAAASELPSDSYGGQVTCSDLHPVPAGTDSVLGPPGTT